MAFVPFSEKSRLWSLSAKNFAKRCLAACDALASDPWQLAPAVGLQVMECSFQRLTKKR